MKKFIAILLVATLFTSCATILANKNQKVYVNTKKSKTKVYVNGMSQGTGSKVTAKMKRDRDVKQIKLVTPGYKDRYFVHYQNKRHPLKIMSFVPFGILIYPMFLDRGPKAFSYEKEATVHEKLIAIKEKSENERYLFLKNTAFDIKEDALKVRSIKHRQLKKNKTHKFKEVETNDEKIDFDNSIFSDSLEDILVKYKYTDTLNTIFKDRTNTLYVSAKITKLKLDKVYSTFSLGYQRFMISSATIEWDVQDIYGQSKYKKIINTKSGEFAFDYYGKKTVLKSLDDAISASFLKLIGSSKVKKLLEKGKVVKRNLEIINLPKGGEITSVKQAMDATVTIKVKEGHGSGFMVSNNGYVLTNFHVVAGSEKDLTVIDMAGKEFKAKLIRKDEFLDLALLKIEKSVSNHFFLPAVKNHNVGDDIFVIGTPNSLELGQSISKGIISGERVKGNVKFIQTDASINPGNSGGPMMGKTSYKLYGVVNAKISGVGVEGLGFAIPAELIGKAMFLK